MSKIETYRSKIKILNFFFWILSYESEEEFSWDDGWSFFSVVNDGGGDQRGEKYWEKESPTRLYENTEWVREKKKAIDWRGKNECT